MLNLDPYKSFIVELAQRSGALIRPYFGDQSLVVDSKADATPVTQADRGAELLLRELITARFPRHGIIGEEFGNQNAGAEFVWMLDPIDGTKSFASASPLFGTLIALQHDGQPVLGCIHQPVLNQLLIGDGESTTLNGQPIRVRERRRIEDTTLLVTALDLFWTQPPSQPWAPFEALMRRAKLFRTWGDCYGYLLLATGWADIMCDPEMNPWDIAALIPVVRGAGGVITDWQGNDAVGANSIVATTGPELHAEVIAALNA